MMAQYLSHTHSARCLKNVVSYNVMLFIYDTFTPHMVVVVKWYTTVQQSLVLYDTLQLGYLSVISQVYLLLKAASADFGSMQSKDTTFDILSHFKVDMMKMLINIQQPFH